MNESDVTAVLTEVAAQLTERGIGKSDSAAVLEWKGGTADAVAELRSAGLVDLEAARRIRGLKPETTGGPKRRGPKPGTVNGRAPASSSVGAAVPVAKSWGEN